MLLHDDHARCFHNHHSGHLRQIESVHTHRKFRLHSLISCPGEIRYPPRQSLKNCMVNRVITLKINCCLKALLNQPRKRTSHSFVASTANTEGTILAPLVHPDRRNNEFRGCILQSLLTCLNDRMSCSDLNRCGLTDAEADLLRACFEVVDISAITKM